MCRHLAYLGPPITLDALLLTPPHSLLHQSYRPRHQRHGTVNADGFGAGWWSPDVRAEPARYRTAAPIWSDRSFASLAGVISAGAVVAAVRSATPPLPVEESGCAPFTAGPWLFSHNGVVDGWTSGANVGLRRQVSATRSATIEGATDSEVLFALALDRLDDGVGPADALRAVIATVADGPGGRLNLLISDGAAVAATTFGDTLFVRTGDGATAVASEPFDDDAAWVAVPDCSVVEATAGAVTVTALASTERHCQ